MLDKHGCHSPCTENSSHTRGASPLSDVGLKHVQCHKRCTLRVGLLDGCVHLAGTFTKSFGSAGGYIAGSKALITYLRRHCPAHLYATSMAPGVAQQIISAIQLLQGKDGSKRGAQKIKQLHDNSNYFRCAEKEGHTPGHCHRAPSTGRPGAG